MSSRLLQSTIVQIKEATDRQVGVVDGNGADKRGGNAVKISFGQEGYQKYRKYENCGNMLLHIKDVLEQQTEAKGKEQGNHRNQKAMQPFWELIHFITFFLLFLIIIQHFSVKGQQNIKKKNSLLTGGHRPEEKGRKKDGQGGIGCRRR